MEVVRRPVSLGLGQVNLLKLLILVRSQRRQITFKALQNPLKIKIVSKSPKILGDISFISSKEAVVKGLVFFTFDLFSAQLNCGQQLTMK